MANRAVKTGTAAARATRVGAAVGTAVNQTKTAAQVYSREALVRMAAVLDEVVKRSRMSGGLQPALAGVPGAARAQRSIRAVQTSSTS